MRAREIAARHSGFELSARRLVVVINALIGIVLNSMEAREAERRKAVRDRLGVEGPGLVDRGASAPVVERINILRAALDDLESELSAGSRRDVA